MVIQSTSPYSASPLLNISGRQKEASIPVATASITATPAFSASQTTISQAARELLAAAETREANTEQGSRHTASFDTNRGTVPLDIDAYFTPPTGSGFDLDTHPLLMPSQKNINALSAHISATMPQFLARHGIPSAPSNITYNNFGQIQLPANYPHAAAFEQALEKEPALARELSTIRALTSTNVAMKKSIPFQQEYAAASSPAEINAVIAKYRYLFSNNRTYDTIALNFSVSGESTLTANGKAIT